VKKVASDPTAPKPKVVENSLKRKTANETLLVPKRIKTTAASTVPTRLTKTNTTTTTTITTNNNKTTANNVGDGNKSAVIEKLKKDIKSNNQVSLT